MVEVNCTIDMLQAFNVFRGCFVAVVNREGWVDGFYKYNSAGRVFQPVPSKSFSVMTDGVSLDVTQLRRAAKEAAASGFVL